MDDFTALRWCKSVLPHSEKDPYSTIYRSIVLVLLNSRVSLTSHSVSQTMRRPINRLFKYIEYPCDYQAIVDDVIKK